MLAFDLSSGVAYRTNTEASVVVTDSPETSRSGTDHQRAIVVFPGYAADCHAISDAFTPYLLHNTSLIVVCYAERGVDDQQIYQLVASSLQELSPDAIHILGGSMGGMFATRFLEIFQSEAGARRVDDMRLILDTSPTSATEIKAPAWVFKASHWYRGGVISSLVWAGLTTLNSEPVPEAGADRSAIERGNEYNRWIGLPALSSQAEYLANFSLSEITGGSSLLDETVFVETAEPQDDPLIRVDPAIESWRSVFPELAVHTLSSRRGKWHIPWTYRPQEILAVVQD